MRNHWMPLRGKMLDRKTTLAGAAALFLSACGGGTTVELANGSKHTLENVSVKFTGGTTAAVSILVGRKATVSFNPTGESSVEISYLSSAGPQSCSLDTYLEPDYLAEFHIELQDRTCRVTFQKVGLPLLYGVGPL